MCSLAKCHYGALTRDTRLNESQKQSCRRLQAGSNLAVVEVTTQGDVTNQLRTVHQICKESAKREERERCSLRNSKWQIHTEKYMRLRKDCSNNYILDIQTLPLLKGILSYI